MIGSGRSNFMIHSVNIGTGIFTVTCELDSE